MQKFLSQVSHAMQQLSGDVTLPVSATHAHGAGQPSASVSNSQLCLP
jgi:hypothetical protein